MSSLIVSKPGYINKGSKHFVSASVEIDENYYEIWYSAAESPAACRSEFFLAAALLSAMKLGKSLKITGQVSPLLLKNIEKIQEIFHTWDSSLQIVKIEADAVRIMESALTRGIGCFFTGGVDSFYTLLKHRNEITHLIFVHGFDISLDNITLRSKVSRALREIAFEFQKPLIEVETNLRSFSDKFVSWDLYHGAGLASIALLLSPLIQKIYIPATHSYSFMHPLGSHPLLDPLWGTEDLEIMHDGCEVARPEKVIQIVSCDTVLKYLRVCWVNSNGAYNCGKCEKCLRTMIQLQIAGALRHCKTFDRPLDLKALAHKRIKETKKRHLYITLDTAKRLGSDPNLIQALSDCLNSKYNRGIRKLIKRLNFFG